MKGSSLNRNRATSERQAALPKSRETPFERNRDQDVRAASSDRPLITDANHLITRAGPRAYGRNAGDAGALSSSLDRT